MGTALHLIYFHSLLLFLPSAIAINWYPGFFFFCFIYFKIYVLFENTLSFFYIQEHEKRCWSVDFNLMDPKLLASGSDDAKGTIWTPSHSPAHNLNSFYWQRCRYLLKLIAVFCDYWIFQLKSKHKNLYLFWSERKMNLLYLHYKVFWIHATWWHFYNQF